MSNADYSYFAFYLKPSTVLYKDTMNMPDMKEKNPG